MADFDAELYLRLAGERMILSRAGDARGSGWSSPIVDIASALVAIDALSLDRAQTIARDYEMALGMRGNQRSMGGMFRNTARAAEVKGTPLEPVRVVRCDATVTTSWGTIETHYALLSADKTTLAITATETGRSSQGMPAILGNFEDDEGNQAQGHFSGGGGGNIYRGYLEAHPGLSTTTKWIELDGHRIELHDLAKAPTIEIEQLRETSPAERHLWKLISGSMGHGPRRVEPDSIESIIDVFIAAGSITPGDAALRQVRAVVNAISTNDRSSPDLPAAWASILARVRGPFHGGSNREGETRTILVGATPPPIDGVYLRINAIAVTGQEFSANVAVSPGSALGSWGPSLGGNEIAWWAEDERGNHYIGSVGNGGGSPERSQGTVNFTPPLATGTKTLRLLPTATTERVAVTIPIADQENTR